MSLKCLKCATERGDITNVKGPKTKPCGNFCLIIQTNMRITPKQTQYTYPVSQPINHTMVTLTGDTFQWNKL